MSKISRLTTSVKWHLSYVRFMDDVDGADSIDLYLSRQYGREVERPTVNMKFTGSNLDADNFRSYCFGAQEGLWHTTCAHLISHDLVR